MKYRIRINHTLGNPRRGSTEHVSRVFDETNKELIFKNFILNVPSSGEKDEVGENWNVTCEGELTIDKSTSTAIINPLSKEI